MTAVLDSVAFVKEFIPSESSKILEVGTGKALIAPALSQAGYRVTVVDTAESDFLELDSEEAFDAVLFSHSFRRMASLETALAKAKKLLSDTGKILIDDRAHEAMDTVTASWFYPLLDLYSILAGTESESRLFPGDSPLDRWKREHQPESPLHSQAEIVRVMERNFGGIHSASVPYLYRYFIEGSASLARGNDAVEKVYELEKSAIQDGSIKAVGFRIASKKYFSYLK